MDFDPPHRTSRRVDSMVPMINVVFLLMIFFLMSTTLSPEVTALVEPPASAAGETAPADRSLVVSADGSLAWGAARGEEALAAIAAAVEAGEIELVLIQADRTVDGAVIARLMTQLGEAGVRDSALVTAAGG
ncbi:MAG: biopolymer transporter ExbD [Pseudomonadota bacterium]